MSKRKYARCTETMHPNAIPFARFVHDMSKEGLPVTRAMAIKWAISAYKREALIRKGANIRAADAARSLKKKTEITRKAIGFVDGTASITDRDAEAFYETGLSMVVGHLCRSRSGTYDYEKESGVFVCVTSASSVRHAGCRGVQKRILEALSDGDMTANAIARDKGIDASSVRNNLNNMRRAGLVEGCGREKTAKRGKPQIVWRIKEANHTVV